MAGFGKILIFFGLLLIFLGLAFSFADKLPYIGRLPGDILIKKERFSFYFPLTTCILISLLLTFLFSLLRR